MGVGVNPVEADHCSFSLHNGSKKKKSIRNSAVNIWTSAVWIIEVKMLDEWKDVSFYGFIHLAVIHLLRVLSRGLYTWKCAVMLLMPISALYYIVHCRFGMAWQRGFKKMFLKKVSEPAFFHYMTLPSGRWYRKNNQKYEFHSDLELGKLINSTMVIPLH